MAKLHLYVPDEVEKALRLKAKAANHPLSHYLAEIIRREVSEREWPEGYFEKVIGKWDGDLERPPQESVK